MNTKSLADLLSELNQGIQSLQARKAAGENVDTELSDLFVAKSKVEAASGETQPLGQPGVVNPNPPQPPAPQPSEQPSPNEPPPDATPEQQVKWYQQRDRQAQSEAVARQVAEQAVAQYRAAQHTDAARVAQIAQETVAKALGLSGGADIQAVVEQAMRNARGESRFAGQGASTQELTQLAAGNTRQPSVEVGEHLGVKKIREDQNLAHYMSMLARVKDSGEFRLREDEKGFMREVVAKAMAEGTDSAGGFLIHPEWMPDILSLLRANTVVRQATPRVIRFAKLMNQTSISSGATASYGTAENAAIPTSEMTLAEAPLLTPKNLTALVPVSNYLLSDAPEADGMVRADLVEVMALREDLAFLQGTGAGGEPRGFKNVVGRTVNPVNTGTDGAFLTMPQTRKIKQITRTFNSLAPRWQWFWPPQFLNHLEGLTDADGKYLVDTSLLSVGDGGTRGTYDGVPFVTTTQIPVNITTGANSDTTYLLLVDMSQAIIGDNQTLELAVSTEASYTPDGGTSWISAFQNQQTLFRAVARHDLAHRRPNHVVVQTGVRV